MRWIDIRRKRLFCLKVWREWAKIAKEEGDEKRSEEFCKAFYQKGLYMRALRHWKLFS